MLPLTPDQRADRIQSTRTFRRVHEQALANGLTPEVARLAAYNASRAALDRRSPGWDKGRGEGFWTSLFT